MGTYVAFLRGINLGPTRKVDMAGLKAVTEGLGYTDVWTYLNTGNVGLSTDQDPTTVEQELAAALQQAYGARIDVTVRSADELRAVLAANPYPDESSSKVTVAFLCGAARPDAQERVAATATPAEPFTFSGREVWVCYGDGQARSKLAAGFSRVVGVSATVRTVGTVSKIVGRLDGS